jgi:hypothetical protein
MEVLNDFKAKYASRLIVESLHTNMYSAFLEAERVEKGELKQIFTDIEDYYIVHNENWVHPYVIKKSRQSGKCNFTNDPNLKRIDW